MAFRVSVDIGGTCTDTTVMDGQGNIYIGKELSTYPDFSEGILDSLQDATGEMSVSGVGDLLENTSMFLHATTIGENTIFEREGAETGLITTAGFEDTLHATRGGYGRWSGLQQHERRNPVGTDKPDPIIPDRLIAGVPERVHKETVLRELDRDEVLDAVEALVKDGVESLACCFLWSFSSPEHETRVSQVVAERFPDISVSISSEVAPAMGEYERTSTTVLNAYLRPTIARYLDSLEMKLKEHGFDGTMLLMFAHGGLVAKKDAIERPIGLIESGPVGGLLGTEFTSDITDEENLISTDMGGTTFKGGVIRQGQIEYAEEMMVGRHHYQFPKRDVHSIPIASGSVVWLDELNTPHVGPRSAGSDPGPVCYDRGGTEPTVTDVDLILGYLSPENFLGQNDRIDADMAYEVFEERIAEPLGKPTEEAAADVYKLTNSKIADFLRKLTIEKGIDPRTLTLSAIGGAAGMHAAEYARDLDISEVIVPYTASVHSAFGLLTTDVIHEYVRSYQHAAPFDVEEINEVFEELLAEGRDKLDAEGFSEEDTELKRFINMRYNRQVHQVVTPLENEAPLSQRDLDSVLARFEQMYEERYGSGSTFRREAIEMVEFRVRAIGALDSPEISPSRGADPEPDDALVESKNVRLPDGRNPVEAEVYRFGDLSPGNVIQGPSIVLSPVTTIVVHPTDEARMDEYRNVRIHVGAKEDGENHG